MDFNIADKPTRKAKLPYPIKEARISPFLTNLLPAVTESLKKDDNGFFDPDGIDGR